MSFGIKKPHHINKFDSIVYSSYILQVFYKQVIRMRPTFAEINCTNLRYNYLNIRKTVKGARVMAVIKADAYGHGMVECANALNKADVRPEYFGVALAEEGIELRKSGISQPILVFSPFLRSDAEQYFKYELMATIFSTEHLKLISEYTHRKKLKVHVKIDTGMGRLGVKYSEAAEFVKKAVSEKNIVTDGIYTHFATSDEADKSFAELQLSRFRSVVDRLRKEKINFGLAHAANSGAILDMPDSYFDMVRPGISLYGYYPSEETSESIKLKPVMSLISFISNVKEIEKGESVSYGRKYIAAKNTRIASIPAGYADGILRGLTNRIHGIVKGKLIPQVGQICMDRIMFDLNGNKIRTGDRVVLLGREGKVKIDAWDWSRILNTIPYEITCNISKRVPRFYTGE